MEVFSGNMKLAALIEANYYLLQVLSRLGIRGSFGERTVSEACMQAGLDTDTVMLLCKVYSVPNFKPTIAELRNSHIMDVLRYLHQCHDYYLNTAIKSMAEDIEDLIIPCTEPQKEIIRKFFSVYKSELRTHFEFEEREVIPYVQDLMLGRQKGDFNIDRFEENHSNIEEKLSDFKNIVMKSLPHECDDQKRISLLRFIYGLQTDLKSHTYIEDNVLVPMVHLLENPQRFASCARETEQPEDRSQELSDREKEILVSVTQGLINKEIADKHHISINTVITHRRNITRKTGIRTVSGLTVYAILNNLINLSELE